MNLPEPARAYNDMVDVSVITAAWNAQHTITRAIMSALSQSGVTVEVIVADDASTDATGAVVTSLDDTRIRYLRLPMNGGPAAARNAAIKLAQGNGSPSSMPTTCFFADRLANLVAMARET